MRDSVEVPSRIEIRPSRGSNIVKFLLLWVLMTGLSAFALSAGGEEPAAMVFGGIGVAFFGVGGGFALWSMIRTPWTVAITPDALEMRRDNIVTRAPWEDIEAIGLVEIHGQKMPSIRLSSYERYIDSHSPEAKRSSSWRIGAMKLFAGLTALFALKPELAGHALSRDIEGFLLANRAMTGFDISFSWAQLDRPARKFTEMLEREWRARRQPMGEA